MMTETPGEPQNAYELIDTVDADVLRGPEGILTLDYECPRCGQTDGMCAETYGVQAICWCPDCEEENPDEFETYGVFELIGQYVLEKDRDFSLRDVPVDRVLTVDGEEVDS